VPEDRIVQVPRSELAALRAASEQAARELAEAENKAVRERMLGGFIDAFENGNDATRAEAMRSLFDFLEGAIPAEQSHVRKSEQEKKAAWREAKAEAVRNREEEKITAVHERIAERGREQAEKADQRWDQERSRLQSQLMMARTDAQEKKYLAEQATAVYRNALANDVSGSNAERLTSERNRAEWIAAAAQQAVGQIAAELAAHDLRRPTQLAPEMVKY
jgi:hypothetical protein